MVRVNINVGDEVKALRGNYADQIGVVVEKGKGQYDVKFPDGEIRYYGYKDIEKMEKKKVKKPGEISQERLAYLKSEIENEFQRGKIAYTEKMVYEIVEDILKNYDVTDISDREFDEFVDSDVLNCLVSEMID
ncbi:hypothetical protein D3C76_00930 [compost metagenome]